MAERRFLSRRGKGLLDLLLSIILGDAVLVGDKVLELLAVALGGGELLGGDLVELGAEGSAGLLNGVGHGD